MQRSSTRETLFSTSPSRSLFRRSALHRFRHEFLRPYRLPNVFLVAQPVPSKQSTAALNISVGFVLIEAFI
jgi:hypothetical protein